CLVSNIPVNLNYCNPSLNQVCVNGNSLCGVSAVQQPSCTDTDNGLNYNVRGTVTQGSLSYTDYCELGNNLFEGYCAANGSIITNYLYVCPNGCSDGACLSATPVINQTSQTPPLPDLIVLNISITPSNPTNQDRVTYRITVKNIGTAASGISTLWFNNSRVIGRLFPDSIAPGSTYTTVDLGGSSLAGTRTITVIADADNTIPELNENNNVLVKTYTVAQAPPALNVPDNIRITTSAELRSAPFIYGNYIVWRDFRDGNYEIYMYDLSTNQERRLITGTIIQSVASIYENNILLQRLNNTNNSIYLYDLSTNQERRITLGNHDHRSPYIYGNKILWEDYRKFDYRLGGIKNTDIYMYDLSTNQERQITTNPLGQYYPHIYGDKIVWYDLVDVINSIYDIYMYDLSTNQERRIIARTGSSPSIYGDKIVWSDNRNGILNSDIYMYDLSTNQERQITTNNAGQGGAIIYADKIVWTDNRNGNYDIYMYDLSTNQERQITTDAAAQVSPSIYGNKIVWADSRNGHTLPFWKYDIYMATIS
ncbi:hypothetical protein HYY71_00830, partial [Candidatus Woesearchaeota archaeon]|nr:hypothetical protein [Candidatus Woesearchaeota archaeon]